MFTELFPILTVRDLSRSLRFYRDLLGGTQTYRFPPEGEPGYVGLRLAGADVGLAAGTGPPAGTTGIDLCLYTADCDAAVAHLRGNGVPVVAEPADQPWGERMARVSDPDGYGITIMARLTDPAAG
jgi:lactoylglutathione lyase